MLRDRAAASTQKSLVGFELGGVGYAIDISKVVQIVNPLPMDRLPRLPPHVLGVAEFRGDVVPVVDLRSSFGAERGAGREKWIVARTRRGLVALVVDAVTDVFGTRGAELKPPPELGAYAERRALLGVATHGDRRTFVLDLEKLGVVTAAVEAAP
ncbi:MAG: purine-binding chemotaxis protein CheW [Polyangiaceae bacterium]|nr:purine-binding chemotaxis protein CheW [Polyangiaceae bacterium]